MPEQSVSLRKTSGRALVGLVDAMEVKSTEAKRMGANSILTNRRIWIFVDRVELSERQLDYGGLKQRWRIVLSWAWDIYIHNWVDTASICLKISMDRFYCDVLSYSTLISIQRPIPDEEFNKVFRYHIRPSKHNTEPIRQQEYRQAGRVK